MQYIARPKTAFFAFLIALFSTPLAAEDADDPGWVLFREHMKEQSRTWFAAHTGGSPFQPVNLPGDQALLQGIADRISRAAGQGDYTSRILIVENPALPNMVNAATYPGGEILFLKPALDLCRKRAAVMAAEKNELNARLGAGAAAHHYENLVAAIMGHELGHYYGRHYLRKYSTMIKSMRAGEAVQEMKQISYSHGHELEADQFGYTMLGKAGYDPTYMVHALTLLKTVSAGANPYLSSHPSMNERLARLTSGESKKLFERLAELEAAFAAVETGGKSRLKQAAKILERELKESPDNPYLIATAAKVYHRLWEESCDVDEIMFKASILHTPFRDEMLFNQGPRTRSLKKVPGNQFYFKQARAYYERALPMTDILTVSAFSALASYDPELRPGALRLAMQVVERGQKLPDLLQTVFLNNAGIALYNAGDYQNAVKAFHGACSNLDANIKKWIAANPAAAGQFLKRQRVLQSASDRNTGQLIEAYFNLGQFFHLRGEKEASKILWTKYVTNLDRTSVWSQYAADEIDLEVEAPKVTRVAGVHPGMGIPELVNKWGNPDERGIDKANLDRWVYAGRGAQLYLGAGFVASIVLGGEKAPAVLSGVRVGLERAALEAKLGKPAAVRGSMALYPLQRMVVVYDMFGKVEQLVLN